MNIFALSTDPIQSAEMMCDKHIVKMVIETAQLLSTAHRMQMVKNTLIVLLMVVVSNAGCILTLIWKQHSTKHLISITRLLYGLVRAIITITGYTVILMPCVESIHTDMVKFT